MKNPKNQGSETIETKIRSVKSWIRLFAFALIAAFAILFAVGGTQPALADKGGERGHAFEVTFTKWITNYPNMAGVVGGVVGPGSFAGEILSLSTTPDGTTTNIEALYHMNGSRHSFTAHVFVTQDNVTGTAVINGGVTAGWLKGAPVAGEYTVMPVCPIPTPGNSMGTLCFQGTLQVLRGFEQ